jgi:hypothetical protein
MDQERWSLFGFGTSCMHERVHMMDEGFKMPFPNWEKADTATNRLSDASLSLLRFLFASKRDAKSGSGRTSS